MFFVKLKFAGLLLTVLLVGGCSTDDDQNNEASQNNDQPQTINYETKGEQNERLGLRNQTTGEEGSDPRTEQDKYNRGDNTTGSNTDMFTTKQSKQIADRLMERQDIKSAQVAITDEKVIVGVMLNDHSDHDVIKGIKEEVREFENDKTIVVYTDDNNWDRANNLKARLKQANLPNEIKENMRDFFNPDRNR